MRRFAKGLLVAIGPFLAGVYYLDIASQGHSVPSRGVMMDAWQFGGLGIGFIIMALVCFGWAMKKSEKNGAPTHNDIALKTTYEGYDIHHAAHEQRKKRRSLSFVGMLREIWKKHWLYITINIATIGLVIFVLLKHE